MSDSGKEIKFRADAQNTVRLRWAMYCNSLDSWQDAMTAALECWLDAVEQKFGPPPAEPKRKRA